MAEEQNTFELRYIGERFKGARLPLDILSDLPAFRDLLVSYAKERWHSLNQSRVRLPKGFERSISFDLISIEDGSAIPKIDWSVHRTQQLLPGFVDEMEEMVRGSYEDLVSVIDGAANDHFPTTLSAEQIRALNRFGAGLRKNEKIEFVGSKGADGNVVYLDATRRKTLITHTRETYEVEYENTGRLVGIHEQGRLSILTQKFGEITVTVEPDRIEEFDGNLGNDIQFSLKIELDSHDSFRVVKSVNQIDLIENSLSEDLGRCKSRLSDLEELENGWHEGEGDAISSQATNAARALLCKRPDFASAYRIFPTLPGGILFEFVTDGWDVSIEFDAVGRPEIYGVQLEGPDELLPRQFEGLDDDFWSAFDQITSR